MCFKDVGAPSLKLSNAYMNFKTIAVSCLIVAFISFAGFSIASVDSDADQSIPSVTQALAMDAELAVLGNVTPEASTYGLIVSGFILGIVIFRRKLGFNDQVQN